MAYTDIDKSDDYFNIKLYTGNGSTNAITGVGFQPDWVWCKARSYNDSHFVFDAVRGVTKNLQTNSTSAEVTNANSLTAFGSDGFTLGSDGGANSNGDTYASWNWLADNTSGSSNTDGSITSTVSANTTSGFSIVSYTGGGSFGDTVGHGLSAVPAMIIVKTTNATSSWYIWQKAMGANDNQFMDFSTGALQTSGATIFDVSAMSSTTFTLGTNTDVNGSGSPKIAYCFAEKKGFSKFGNYVGSGTQANDYGNQIYCGFRPKMIMVKQSDAVRDWLIYDTSRLGYNDRNDLLFPNKSDSEFATDRMMLLSNGFAPRNDSAELNADGGTYIYWAFAENPFVTSTGIPTTAR